MLFEARPIGMERRSGLRVNIRSAGEILAFKAVRVTVTTDCQHLTGPLESEIWEQNRTKCARGSNPHYEEFIWWFLDDF
jgi:hypothetical protein